MQDKVIALGLAGLLVSCALPPVAYDNTPALPYQHGIKTTSVLFSIECEIIDALDEISSSDRTEQEKKNINPQFLKSLAAKVVTDLNIERNNQSDASLLPNVALASAGRLTGTFKGKSNLKRTKKTTITSNIYFVLAIENNRDKCNDESQWTNGLRRINGVLGFKAWLTELIDGFEEFGINLTQLDYKTEFVLVNDANLGVSFMPVEIFADRLGVNANANFLNAETHTITINTILDPKLPASVKKDRSGKLTIRQNVKSTVDENLNKAELIDLFRSDSNRIVVPENF